MEETSDRCELEGMGRNRKKKQSEMLCRVKSEFGTERHDEGHESIRLIF